MSELIVLIDGIENDEYDYCEFTRSAVSLGCINNTPAGMEADSLNCIMTLLGVEQSRIPQGRAYLEAAAAGMPLNDDDLVFRCNFIETDSNGRLASSCKIAPPLEMENERLKLKHLEKHKYILIIKGAACLFDTVKTYPPHQYIGASMAEIAPRADASVLRILNELIERRSIFPWGQAVKRHLPTYREMHGTDGAIVAKTEIVAGIAAALKMHCPPLQNATGDVDTDLAEKARAALALCGKYGFVLLHINGADESAHRRNKGEKIDFIKRIDKEVIRFIMENARMPLEVLVMADHETSAETGRHVNSAVKKFLIELNGGYNG